MSLIKNMALVALLSLGVSALPTSEKLVERASGNPFSGYQLYPVPQYAQEIKQYAIPNLSSSMAAAAKKVSKVGTFFWMDTASKVRKQSKEQSILGPHSNSPYLPRYRSWAPTCQKYRN